MYSREEKIQITEAFLESCLTVGATRRMKGWPSTKLLSKWLREAKRGELPINVAVPKGHAGQRKRHARYSAKTKAEAIRLYEMGRRPVDIGRLLGIEGYENIRVWWKKAMKGDKLPEKTFKPKPLEDSKEVEPMDEKKKKKEPTKLSDIKDLELENALLRELVTELKKADGWDLTSISNKQKVRLGESLRQEPGRSLKEITDFLKISKSSYEYHRKRLSMPDKLASVKEKISTLFRRNKARYGSRRIWALLRLEGVFISEKVVRRIMKELGLVVRYEPKAKRFYSYEKGMLGAVDNLVNRNFRANRQNSLWLTDITEFRFNSIKCYLSPIIDCFDGKVVAWNTSRYPDASLVNDMLAEAIATLKNGEHPILHTDRGAHFRWPGWLEQCDKAGLRRSMSAKGCTPDNAACEGFFGRLKNEFFNHRSWRGFSYEQFAEELNEYIAWYNETRIKESLGWMSPARYRLSLGLVG